MRVNTDSIILGSWLRSDHPACILDIGTGTGILALMMAQRHPFASIDAIEIEEQACLDAQFNFEQSQWRNRLRLIHDDVYQWSLTVKPAWEYDLIVSNPPFFEASLPSMDSKKKLARHQSHLTYGQMIGISANLLTEDGILVFIVPHDVKQLITRLLTEHNLHIHRQLAISSNDTKPPHRIIFEVGKVQQTPTTHYLSIYERDAHEYTNEFKTLTADFYLSL